MWLLLILCSALILRVLCMQGDLWLDEIWSIQLARNASSPWDVLFGLHHDNNHHLNTLIDFLLNEPQTLWLYRLGPVLAGTLAVFMAYRCAREGREALTTAIMFAFSFLLVFYSSEARGYAYLMLFTLSAYWCFQMKASPWRQTFLFSAACVLGFLSHLSFLYAFCGFAAWGIVNAVQERNWRSRSLWMTVPSGLFALFLWLVDLRFLEIGGDQPSALAPVLTGAAGMLMTGVTSERAGACALLLLIGGAVWTLRKESRGLQAFFFVSVLGAPAAVLLFRRQEFLSPRYFLVPGLFLLLLFARFLSRELRRSVLIGALVAFVILNTWSAILQFRAGRGTYSEALKLICTADPHAEVGSDHDFRNGVVLEFYSRNTPGCSGVTYEPMQAWAKHIPGWLILHSLERSRPAPEQITPQGLGGYRLTGFFPSGEISGWSWAVYRLER